MDERKEELVTSLLARGVKPEDIDTSLKEVYRLMSQHHVAGEIAQQKGISQSWAYKLARKESLQNQPAAPEGWSRKEYILEALFRINSNVGVSQDALLVMLQSMGKAIGPEELFQSLWSLQKGQLVRFDETKNPGDRLKKIRLTMDGRQAAREKRGDPQEYSGPRVHKGSRKLHQVGVDRTNVATHGTHAEGGPVERIRAQGTSTPEIIEAPVYELPRIGDPLPQNMKTPLPVIDETSVVTEATLPLVAAQGTDMEAQGKALDVALSDYPLLSNLVERKVEKAAARVKAAKLVEAASLISDIDPDQAEVLMQHAVDLEGPSFSELEKEVLRLAEALGW